MEASRNKTSTLTVNLPKIKDASRLSLYDRAKGKINQRRTSLGQSPHSTRKVSDTQRVMEEQSRDANEIISSICGDDYGRSATIEDFD